MSISKLPYEVDSELSDGAWGRYSYYKLMNADGRVIADGLNSEVSCIETGDEGEMWDEQGRLDLTFIATACNSHFQMLDALERAERWLGMMIADGAHQKAVAPQHCEETLNKVVAAIAAAKTT